MIQLNISKEDFEAIQRLIGDQQYSIRKEIEASQNSHQIAELKKRYQYWQDLGGRFLR